MKIIIKGEVVTPDNWDRLVDEGLRRPLTLNRAAEHTDYRVVWQPGPHDLDQYKVCSSDDRKIG